MSGLVRSFARNQKSVAETHQITEIDKVMSIIKLGLLALNFFGLKFSCKRFAYFLTTFFYAWVTY